MEQEDSKERFRPGDVFQGYYFPGVLCGRTMYYYKDLIYLLRKYKNKVRKLGKVINFKEPGTFGIMSKIYKQVHFSSVQFCTEIEESSECFQILIGVVLKLLNKNIDLESLAEMEDEEVEQDIVEDLSDANSECKRRRVSLSITNRKTSEDEVELEDSSGNSVDLRVSMMIMQSLEEEISDFDAISSVYNSNWKNNEVLLNDTCFQMLHHNVSLIYILYLIYKSQYKISLEDSFSDIEISSVQRIPITIETFKTIKEILETCKKKGNVFPEIKHIISQMMNEGILVVNLYDGPQYYYQDRYGNPLMPDPLEKRFAETKYQIPSSDTIKCNMEFLGYLKELNSKLFDKIKHATSLKSHLNDNNNRESYDKLISSSLELPENNLLYDLKLLYSELSVKIKEYENNCLRYEQSSLESNDNSKLNNRNENYPDKTADGEATDEILVVGNDYNINDGLNRSGNKCANWREVFVSGKLRHEHLASDDEKTRVLVSATDKTNNNSKTDIDKDNAKNLDIQVDEEIEILNDIKGNSADNGKCEDQVNNSDCTLKYLLDKIEELVNKEIS